MEYDDLARGRVQELEHLLHLKPERRQVCIPGKLRRVGQRLVDDPAPG